MIKIENVTTSGWEPAIRGMRNPMNSWDKSDSIYCDYMESCDICKLFNSGDGCLGGKGIETKNGVMKIGQCDHDLMMRLRNAGTDHRKFMRMIVCYADITAPLYWWKEADTYRNGVEKNSCSTMHKIADHEFTMDDFSTEHIVWNDSLENTIAELNFWRRIYLYGGIADVPGYSRTFKPKEKDAWWQMIQLLPSSYNQRRTVMMSYEALANMYHARKNHKLDEWVEFCKWIETLPYSELITGGEENATN